MDLAQDINNRVSKAKITPEIVDQVMIDKYHTGLSANDIKKKHNISAATLKTLDEKYGAAFKERFGVKAKSTKDLTADEMKAYWDGKKVRN